MPPAHADLAKPDAIIFDVGGVLIGHDHPFMCRRLASRCTAPDALRAVEAAFQDRKWDNGAAPLAGFYDEVRRDLGYDGSWQDFLDDWCCHFMPDASMFALVEALATAHRVILFSNTNPEHWDYLAERTDIGRYEGFLSYRMGLSKPSLASFDYVAEHAGIKPSRSLFFDDRIENVDGGRAAGFRSELFTNEARLREVLAGIGIAAC